MMQHRVDTLHLAVHSPPGREAVVAALAERFTRNVLDRFSEIVEARSPGRVVLIRRMALHWSYSEAELADPAKVADSATELAESVAGNDGSAARASDTAAAFDDEAGWLAAYIRARAAGAAEQWFHATWRDAERHGVGSLSPLRRDTVLAALSRLGATGELAGVLAKLPPATLTSLGTALGIDGATAPRLTAAAGTPVNGVVAGSAPAAEGSLPASSAAGAAAGIDAALAHQNNERPRQPVVPGLLTEAEPDRPAALATRFGGLFYLLSLALELDIGESLWKVCLPEGLVLAHAAAALLGSDAHTDPALALFGGERPGELPELPPVALEQQAELCTELLTSAVVALPRYGVAPSPEVLLELVPPPVGRMLVACAQGAYALFAWPAHDTAAVATGVATFLSAWPRSFPPPRAPKVLLGLDESGRLRSLSDPTVRAAPFLPSARSASASALLTQVCGTMAALFALRAGVTPVDATEIVFRYLAIPGRVELVPQAMTVVLPMDGINVALRRAALDRDPGWVPWLRRTVRIEFAPTSEPRPGG